MSEESARDVKLGETEHLVSDGEYLRGTIFSTQDVQASLPDDTEDDIAELSEVVRRRGCRILRITSAN